MKIHFHLFLVSLWFTSETVTATLEVHVLPKGETQIMVDDQRISHKEGVVRRVHAGRKLDNPVLVSEMPWELSNSDHRVYIFGTVLQTPGGDGFRMWYERFDRQLYATSADGIQWTRPQLGLVDYNGSSQNNILPPLFYLSLDCVSSSCAKQRFTFELVSTFPEAAGLKGYYAMAHDSGYFVMGGSTFPVPQNQGGPKVYFDSIYQLSFSKNKSLIWTKLENRLPYPMAEGTCLQLDDGILIIGGHNTDTIFNQVTHVSWDTDNAAFNYRSLPALPTPCFYPAATVRNNKVYVAGGDNGSGGIHNFWVMDLGVNDVKWKPLPAWPGPKRYGAILELLSDGDKEYLYLFSGKSENTKPRNQDNYLKDVYRFDLDNQSWKQLGDMPRASLIGIPGKLNKNTLAIFSGSDGHDIERLEKIGNDYRLPNDILVYSAINDTWTNEERMPLGLIGVPLLAIEDGFILASGEYSPALRADTVYHIKVNQDIE